MRISERRLPFWCYLGLPPSKVPFHMMASCWDALLKQHPVHIRGRNQALSNAFVETLTECGGEVRFGCGARRIVLKDGTVRAVITDEDEEVATKVVVSNAAIPSTLSDLVGTDQVPEAYRRQVNSRQIGFSTVNIYAGLDCPPGAVGATVHENFIDFGRDIGDLADGPHPRRPGMLFTVTASDPVFTPGTAHGHDRGQLCPALVSRAAGTVRRSEERLCGVHTREGGTAFRVLRRIWRWSSGDASRAARYTGNPGGTIYGFVNTFRTRAS